ncbi:DUF2785 domain-containing protein [Rummeliibacillus sp. NPDC094406]|uniref:DUF2785 domain-containing protein n=1 Tax=Rummeliibacillus sp. NPDC094406 TaxID=3364511 RepID=UPI0038033D56
MKYQITDILAMSNAERKLLIEEDAAPILQEMLIHIGHTDETIRDHQNLRLFLEFIQYDLLSLSNKQYLVSQLTQTSYFYFNIGEKDTDSIFQRALSALWLTYLIRSDAGQAFLTQNQYDEILGLATRYLSKEKDTRGYIEGKGWAYGIANGADLELALIQHPKFDIHDAAPILQSIRDCFWKGTVYVDDEEERFVEIIEALIRKGIDEKLLIEWVEQVFDSLEYSKQSSGYSPLFLKARTQTLHFMKTFYFALKFRQIMPELQGIVSHFIGQWMKIR